MEDSSLEKCLVGLYGFERSKRRTLTNLYCSGFTFKSAYLGSVIVLPTSSYPFPLTSSTEHPNINPSSTSSTLKHASHPPHQIFLLPHDAPTSLSFKPRTPLALPQNQVLLPRSSGIPQIERRMCRIQDDMAGTRRLSTKRHKGDVVENKMWRMIDERSSSK